MTAVKANQVYFAAPATATVTATAMVHEPLLRLMMDSQPDTTECFVLVD